MSNQPPVDNDHVAPGCQLFTAEEIALNAPPTSRLALLQDESTRAEVLRDYVEAKSSSHDHAWALDVAAYNAKRLGLSRDDVRDIIIGALA